MLVLCRKRNQELIVNENIRIKVISVKGSSVRIGIEAPRDVSVLRGELQARDTSTATRLGEDWNQGVDTTYCR